jgi:predicted secreted Zn-dependent protease
MRTRYHLLMAVLLVLVTAGSAQSFTISVFFDSNGNPSSSTRKNSGSGIFHRTSSYAVPEGVKLRKDITYEYYPVFGRSFSEIVKSAAENGPFVKTKDARFTSKTDWGLGISYNYDYTYEIDEDSGIVHATIDISDVAIKYDVAVTLPALLDDSSLNAVEKKLWKNYFRRLLKKEHGRVAIIEDANIRKQMESDIGDIEGVSFDYTDENDIERSVEIYLEEETQEIGSRGIKKIRENLARYDGEKGSGGSPDGLSVKQPTQ